MESRQVYEIHTESFIPPQRCSVDNIPDQKYYDTVSHLIHTTSQYLRERVKA